MANPPMQFLLHEAAAQNDLGTVHSILSTSAPDVTSQYNDTGESPLHVAVKTGAGVAVVEALLDAGVDPSQRTAFGYTTPLHLACAVTTDMIAVDVVKLLLARGADVNGGCTDGQFTPLMKASKNSFLTDVVKVLIDAGADVRISNGNGNTALHYACYYASSEAARLLIAAGADVSAQNSDEETPMFIAARDGQDQIIPMLIQAGADESTPDRLGSTPLHRCTHPSGPEIARMLLQAGASLSSRDYLGQTPLHVAASSGPWCIDVQQLFMAAGADVRCRTNRGDTALHFLLLYGDIENDFLHQLILVADGPQSSPLFVANAEGGTPLFNPAESALEGERAGYYLNTVVHQAVAHAILL